MLRGFLAGGLWGAVIGAVVLALTSQLATFRDLTPAITAAEAEREIAPAPSSEPDAAPALVAEAESTPVIAEETPLASAEAADEISAPMLDTAPPETPVAGALADQAVGDVVAEAEAPEAPAPVETQAVTAPNVVVAEAPSTDAPPEPGAPVLAPASTAPDAQAAAPEFIAPAGEAPPDADVATSADASPRAVVAALSEALTGAGVRPAAQAAPTPVETAPSVAEGSAPEAGTAPETDLARETDAAPRVVAVAPTETPSVTRDRPATPAAPSAVETAREIASAPAPKAGTLPETGGGEAEAAPRVVALVPTEAPSVSGDRPAADPAPQPVEAAPEVALGTPPESGVDTTEIAEERAPEATVPALGAPSEPALAGAEPSIELEVPRIGVITANGDKGSAGEPQIIQVTDEGAPALPGRRASSLPQVGAATSETPAPEAEVVEAPAPEAEPGEVSALDRNRVAFEAPDGAAMIAVVLVHEGGPALDLPLGPLTVAVPARLTDAAAIAQSYRDAGHEVALIPDLPRGATAQDVAVSLPVNLEQVPGAVALMDGDGQGFQGNRGATEGVVATASDLGLGLLTWPKGFNTAGRMAGQEGVPAATVFRALEEGGTDAMGRALDQAAFRARQEGGIVLVGRADAGILEGLKTWNDLSRRSDTALAPLSAVLLGG